jgi:hypothetical protein
MLKCRSRNSNRVEMQVKNCKKKKIPANERKTRSHFIVSQGVFYRILVAKEKRFRLPSMYICESNVATVQSPIEKNRNPTVFLQNSCKSKET